jgi:hypothetical protein
MHLKVVICTIRDMEKDRGQRRRERAQTTRETRRLGPLWVFFYFIRVFLILNVMYRYHWCSKGMEGWNEGGDDEKRPKRRVSRVVWALGESFLFYSCFSYTKCQYFSLPLGFLQESGHSAGIQWNGTGIHWNETGIRRNDQIPAGMDLDSSGIHRNPQEWDILNKNKFSLWFYLIIIIQ